MFHNYSTVFRGILDGAEADGDEDSSRSFIIKEKIIALKSSVDGLIVHGLSPDV